MLAPASATAQTNKDKLAQAREHFTKGQQLFELRRYDEALKELMSAFVLDPNPALIYNIARVHEDRGDYASALKFFHNFLTVAPKARNKAAVKRKIRSLSRKLEAMPKRGFLTVNSTPPGASVRLDGQAIGQTPLNAADVPAGPHRVDVILDRFDPYSANVSIVPTQTARLDVTLRDRPSSVLISTVPPGAVATLHAPEPRNLGPCPCVVELGAGRYKLEVAMGGFEHKELFFDKGPGETLKLNVQLVPIDTTGSLHVDANVPGAEIRVDGTPLGRTPLAAPIPVRPGTVLVEVVASGHRAWRGQALIAAGRLTRVQALLDPATPHHIGPGQQPFIGYRADGGGTSGQAIAGWVTLSFGIASLVGGGLTTTFAMIDKQTYDNGEYFRLVQGGKETLIRQDMLQTEAFALEKRAQDLMLASYVQYGVGGALFVTGLILLASDGGGGAPRELRNFSESWPPVRVEPLDGGAVMHLGLSF